MTDSQRTHVRSPDIVGLGQQMLEQQRFDAVIGLGKFLTLAFPDVPEVWDALAQFQRGAGERTAALGICGKALELAP